MNVFEGKPVLSQAQARQALDVCVGQVRRNLPKFTRACQNHSSIHNVYPPCDNDQWTCGFWPGEVWLAYERDGGEAFKTTGLILADSFLDRAERGVALDHHDMGFLYTPACVAAWKLTGYEPARRAALMAAGRLLARFQPVGEFFQAWGELGAPDNYRYIIDCLLNLPLLYWAADESGDPRYRTLAGRHIATCLRHSVRDDGSTFHTVFMDRETGRMSRGATCQGYHDNSSWARGQAWAIYGLALSYRYVRDPVYKEAFDRVLAYYLTRLPDDLVPYWDMIFTSGDAEPRDSSSASITACGLLEMAGLTPPAEARRYRRLAGQTLKSLVDHYSVKNPEESNGLVLHGTYSKKSPYNTCTQEGVDECVSWGDYFYMEALTRLRGRWEPYW
ncbi:MAG: glycoside hydrolase family 88 protein [Oscillospiraceae bacterium]|jgi:unsaturated chondroitin disaccharide hydrolase|nr:glycoside hydrolase family 88 protein [Oscillospiraceae bacterium]